MRRKHILVTDDEKNILRTLEFILEAANYRVSLADRGQKALEIILRNRNSESHIDLLITDLQMPDMSGLTLIQELNKMGINIPKMVITGHGSKDVVIHLMQNRCNDYMEKPIDDEELLKRVELLIQASEKDQPKQQEH